VSVSWPTDRLVFGRMYEDAQIELEALPRAGRIFCVASAGCTAFELARHGAAVTAVDVNPAQVAYVRERLRGAPPRRGATEISLAHLRRLGPLAGWTHPRLRRFCALADPRAQRLFWAEQLDTRRFRAALAFALRPSVARLGLGTELARGVPIRFDLAVRRRLERGFSTHANALNPYARALLLGGAEQPEPPADAEIGVGCADAAAFLEGAQPHSFDGFALSNVLDGASRAYAERLRRAVQRTAAPGAVVVLRSFAEAALPDDRERAARDRALLWGSITLERL
jgi:S-adenosylmethionine:diacylglycerol 3-amino-3-carboxypropyl transferase